MPVKGQMEEIRPVKFREEMMQGGLDGALQNNAGSNERPEKGSCSPFPLLKGQRRRSEAGRMLRAVLRGKKGASGNHLGWKRPLGLLSPDAAELSSIQGPRVDLLRSPSQNTTVCVGSDLKHPKMGREGAQGKANDTNDHVPNRGAPQISQVPFELWQL